MQVAKRLQDYASNLEEMPLAPVENASTGKTLDDMYLSDDVRRLCKQMLADLKAHQGGMIDWAEVPSSLFLSGPPGNGKTMLAEALAGSAGVKLFTTSYGDCQKHGHQGDFLKSLAAKVEWAIKHTPCVLFIDEFDSFNHRNKRDRNSDYIVGIVNTLLEHLTRLNETPGLLLVAAANHKDMIDPALLRPGRFDLHATIDKPTKEGVRKLLEMALAMDLPDGLVGDLVNGLFGPSGAEVAGFVRQAKAAARATGAKLQEQHLRDTLPKVTNPFADPDLNRIAVHEAGHVIVARHLKRPLPDVVRLTNSGGHVASPRARIAALENTLDDVAIDLAGRAAEEAMFGNVSAGAAEDLLYATEMLFAARNHWGLYDDQLVVLPADVGRPVETEARVNAQIDAELQAQYQRAFEIVSVKLDPLVLLAGVLLEKREMDRAALKAFFEGGISGMVGQLSDGKTETGVHPKDLAE
ncbi:AAA family ATPase [uncultured Shimia sp.]|uniref:AAA family ATPase n=1 Tax=uncultured Shimia sp. TaxID=573152 RepID=UPI00263A1CBA|nr:AAA family ATPase [uncultured Shimia sp.]